jgi:phage FluMu gp28-like protein
VARGPDKRSTGKDGGQRHGDAGIAIALMHYASRNPVSPIEFIPVPSGARGFGDNRQRDDDMPNLETRAW